MPVASGLPPTAETCPVASCRRCSVKPRKAKVSGLPSPRCARRTAAWRPNSIRRVLSGCSDSANFCQALAHHIEKPMGIGLVLEPDHHVVGITHDDHVAGGVALSPAVHPQVEDVVQVDVGEQRRDHRSLPRPLVTDRHRPVLEHPRLQPFPDQADDARIADPVLNETDQPVVADRIEKRPDIGVQYPVHLAAADPDHQRIQRIVLAAPRPEPVREPEEIFLVDRVQHHGDRPLDDLVFQGGDRQRSLPAVRLRDIPPPGR